MIFGFNVFKFMQSMQKKAVAQLEYPILTVT